LSTHTPSEQHFPSGHLILHFPSAQQNPSGHSSKQALKQHFFGLSAVGGSHSSSHELQDSKSGFSLQQCSLHFGDQFSASSS
jgi:hypothetical protein